METYSTSALMPQSSVAVLHAAIEVLINNGFAIVKRDELKATLTGPGLINNRQNPLLGASKVRLELRGQHLCLDAELGGVESMRRFLTRFPLLLGLGLGLFFAVAGGFGFGKQFGVGFGVPWAQGWSWVLVAIAFAMLPVSPWLILSPMISHLMRKRTQVALTTLVRNSVQMANCSRV